MVQYQLSLPYNEDDANLQTVRMVGKEWLLREFSMDFN